MDSKNIGPKSSAKDVFSYLLMTILLVWSSISLGTLIWQCINFGWPDALQFSFLGVTSAARTAMAGLIITWPLFVGISWVINQDLARTPAKAELWVRKWLLYFTLFVCGLTAIIDLVTLLNNFLSGELTTRFILKASTILVIAGSIFGYYLWDLRRNPKTKQRIQLVAAILSSLVVLGTVISGFLIIGSPSHQRALRLDNQRVTDLQNLQWQIVSHWQQKGELPAALTDLQDSISGYTLPVDPTTAASYDYRSTAPLTFELCATFTDVSSPFENDATYYSVNGLGTPSWHHLSGPTCFSHTIDPDLYPSQGGVKGL